MSTREKAKEGMRLLEEAVFELMRDRPGITKRETLDELELSSPDEKGEFGDNLLWGIHNLLRAKGLMRIEKVRNRNRFYAVTE